MIAKTKAQIYNASKYSIDGMRFLFRSEFAARLEVYAFFFMIAALLFLRASVSTLLIMIAALLFLRASVSTLLIAVVLFLMLIATEALNTAIEVIIDRISPEISATGKKAKDLGSFAVSCMLAVNAIFFANAVITAPPVQNLTSDILLALA